VSRMRCSAKLLRSGALLIRDRQKHNALSGHGSAAHHFVLRCARDTCDTSIRVTPLFPDNAPIELFRQPLAHRRDGGDVVVRSYQHQCIGWTADTFE